MNRIKMCLVLCSILSMLGLKSVSFAIDSQHLELVGRYGGRYNAVAVQGNYAYILDDHGLTVLDISNSNKPKRVGMLLLDVAPNILTITIQGNYAYLASGKQYMYVVDVSIPNKPVLVNEYVTPGVVYDIAIQGNYAYVADAYSMLILNISSASRPVLVGSYDTTASRVAVNGNLACIYVSNSTYHLLNVSTASNPQYLGTMFGKGASAFHIRMNNQYLYTAGGYLEIFDISIPAHAVAVAQFNSNEPYAHAYDLAVNGNYIYLANFQYLDIVDVSSASQPVLVASITTGYSTGTVNPDGICYQNNTVYFIGMYKGLGIADVSTASSPKLLGEYLTLNEQWNITVDGTRIYLPDYNNGLKIFDISTASNPVLIGACDTPDVLMGVAKSGNYLVGAGGYKGLQIFDISTISKPVIVSTVDTPDFAYGIAVKNKIAYLANGTEGLMIFDFTTAASPSLVTTLRLYSDCEDVVIDGNYAYVAYGNAGLYILDISNPYSPISTGYYNTPYEATGLAVRGNYVYLADHYSLRVIDISSLSNPYIVASYSVQCYKIALRGNYAYVADQYSALHVYDITNPTNLVEVGYFRAPAYAVAVDSSYIYATGAANLWVLKFTGDKLNSYGDFTVASDTAHWYWEKYGDGTAAGTLSWSSTFAGQSGIVKMNQNAGEKGKLTQIFSVPSTGWYTAITKVATDIVDTTKQQKVYLYLQELDSSTAVAATGNLVVQSGNGGFGQASTWRELSVSFYCQSTMLGVQVVGINPVSSGVNGSLYIDSIWVYAEAPQGKNTIALTNSSFDAGTTGWLLNLYADGSGIGSWSQLSSLSSHTGLVKGTQTGGQKAKLSQVYSADADQTLATVWVYSNATSKSNTQKVYLYVYSYDSVYSKVIESGNGILQAGKWTPGQWRQIQFGYQPLTEYNAVQVVGINPSGNPSGSIYFDAVELNSN